MFSLAHRPTNNKGSKAWSMQYAVSGVATVHPPDQPGGQPRVEMEYKTHVFDRYN